MHKFPVEHTVAEATIEVRTLRQIPARPASAITETRNAVSCTEQKMKNGHTRSSVRRCFFYLERKCRLMRPRCSSGCSRC
ncbi:hypothetical protein D9O29_05930 [Pantoea vagans]|uniref:Uncharacterized protein n=1 Tax=Pantoea vagans TaxID=470934 RepID=A0ABY3LIZ8_9GAMM|nr:hypothetical protein D9O29_05930 [Pantoea vagans]